MTTLNKAKLLEWLHDQYAFVDSTAQVILKIESGTFDLEEEQKQVAEADAWCEYWRREAFRKYPTPDAYDAACKALHKQRERADQLEAEVRRLQDTLGAVAKAADRLRGRTP